MEVSESQLDDIKAAVIEATREHESEGVIRVPAKIHIVTASAC